MATKKQMQNTIDELERKLASSRETTDKLTRRVNVLEGMTMLEDHPEGHFQSEKRAEISDSAAEVFKRVADWSARNNGYRDKEDEKTARGIGVLMSEYFSYYGTPILLAAASGLEDANWHSEAHTLFDMYYELKKREDEHR